MPDDPTLFDAPDPLSLLCTCGSILTLNTVHRMDGPCFHYEPPNLDGLGKFQSSGQSDTARRAAIQAHPRTGTQRERILNALLARPVSGLTDEEIGDVLRMNPSSVRPRRVELAHGGWVQAKVDRDGNLMERLTRSGVRAQVWTATKMARDYTSDDGQ